jgi:periplasmic protein TonB
MNGHTLLLPQPRSSARWMLAAIAIILAHLAAAAMIVLGYAMIPAEPDVIPAIAVSLETRAPVSPEQSFDPVAEQKVEQVDATPPTPPDVVQPKVEPPPEKIEPPPPVQSEIALPKAPPKPVEQKKPVAPQQPAQEARQAAAAREAVRVASVAASNVYASRVFGHLQRFKRDYPPGASGASGTVTVTFALSRDGSLLSSSIAKSSGNAALDQEALAMLRRANPFPPFPPEKPGAQESYNAPVNFAR